ncbi:MAG: glucose-6-phosphate isomerase, partial [Rikenellaceae bacterium]|nr:glucose-6-phosphate isomerase [Rikenellaceae bacterium]
MAKVTFDNSNALAFAGVDAEMVKAADAAAELLYNGQGAGNDFIGWVNLPSSISAESLADIKATAASLRSKAEVVVVIGIGGSYLGAKAVYDALGNTFEALLPKHDNPTLVFAGNNINEDYLAEMMEALDGHSIAAIVISKSGTTTEPAIAFRVIKDTIEKRYGKAEAAERIVAVTDGARGVLKSLADTEGYKSYVIPDNVGGRFSVLTPVGLLPLAVAGVDIEALVAGAVEMEKATAASVPFEQNVAKQYAAARNALYRKGYKVEIFATYEPKLQYVAEWWKQLYGESEGKQGKGIFPASVVFSTDLHSMGQYIQDGERMLFETVVNVENPARTMTLEATPDNVDKLNFLAGRRIGQINQMAQLGTMLAHVDGGVPNLKVSIPTIDAENLGALLYFYEAACGISGYILGVNPFDQPGVEAYKRNMFALLGKPGYEAEGEELRKRL